VNATSQRSTADFNVGSAAIQSIVPVIEDAISALASKKSEFASAGLSSLVQSYLAILKMDIDSFADSLTAVSSDNTKDRPIPTMKDTIDSDFKSAISSYAS
jgi:hypothetical protein